jgi:hypothetical protein
MLEIFIPTLIKNNNLEINKISDNFLNVLKDNFSKFKITEFSSTFFE